MLGKRLAEARLEQVHDPRAERGKRWELESLLRVVLGGMMAGAKSLADIEKQTERLSRPLRRLLGIRRRVPDTTLRDTLCSVDPQQLRKPLHAVIRAAQKRGALEPDQLPFGVVALDGKDTSLPSSDDWFAQRQTSAEDGPLVGVLRTMTALLTSAAARPVIDLTPIPAPTNEMGHFEFGLDSLCRAYPGLDFRLITYDAGACSEKNARLVHERGLHYLFGLKGSQPTLFQEAKLWLGSRLAPEADATTEDSVRGQRVVRQLYVGDAIAAPQGWDHLRSVLRVHSQTFAADGSLTSSEDRYFVSSLPRSRLTNDQWLLVIRRHWGVESAHQILDVAFSEDAHPFIEHNPRGALVVAILRRIAYTILTLFRSVTQRSDQRRLVPWKDLMLDLSVAFLTTTEPQIRDLRQRLSS
jgi:hypothetical protein